MYLKLVQFFALVGLTLAITLPRDVEDGLYIISGDEDGNTKTLVRRDVEPSLDYIPNQQPPAAAIRNLWPWGAKSPATTHRKRDLASSANPEHNYQHGPKTPVYRPGVSAGCTNNTLDSADTLAALSIFQQYCEQDGAVPQFEHLAAMSGNSVMFICARGHKARCNADNVTEAIAFVEGLCGQDISGWVYSDAVNAGADSNVMGVQSKDGEFCL